MGREIEGGGYTRLRWGKRKGEKGRESGNGNWNKEKRKQNWRGYGSQNGKKRKEGRSERNKNGFWGRGDFYKQGRLSLSPN